MKRRRLRLAVLAAVGACSAIGVAMASTPGADVRLTHDNSAYVSADNLAGLPSYTDATLAECSRSKGRQNEPAVEVDPRNAGVIVGSSNDYCAVYNNGVDADGAPIPSGPIWLGYYRSEDGGHSFVSSLVPGYPGDTSTLGALAKIRTASSGDPVIAWDAEGRLFMGSESSDDPAGSKKTFGDVFVARYVNSGGSTLNDGKRFAGATIVEKGSSAPNLLGKFNDKTAIAADRTSSPCSGNVYFAWSRFNGNSGAVAIYFSRSTDHGTTFSSPMKLTANIHDLQDPDIAVTGNGHVYVTFQQSAAQAGQRDAVDIVKSTDCGKTFAPAQVLTPFIPYTYIDAQVGGGTARDCGDGVGTACESGYTYPRNGTSPRSTADQSDTTHEWVHIVWEATVPGSVLPTGTTFGSDGVSGEGGQGAIYYARYDGATGALTTPSRIAPEEVGHQFFSDIAVFEGTLHTLWWDSRNDPNYSTARPVGNDASGNVGPALDVFASTKPAADGSWSTAARLSDVTTNPDYEQFSGRTVPFAGDYLWISSQGGTTFGTWTDWRDTVSGSDQRETTQDETGADVRQCRTDKGGGVFTGDTCPREGGLDQNIYGDLAP